MFARYGSRQQWALLLIASIAVTAGLRAAEMPGALLLGPMASAIAFAIGGVKLAVPRPAYAVAQGIVGTMMAGAVTPEIVETFLGNWALFFSVVFATLVASGVVGWAMSRWHVLPGTAAIWGSSPGAASAMVVMAEQFGADVRLVAFMQYLRVLCVALSAALIAHVAGASGVHVATEWFAVPDPLRLGETLLLIGGGMAAGKLLRMPSGALLGPLMIGVVLRGLGLIDLLLPPPLLLVAFATIGWVVGLRFTAEILRTVAAKLPHMLASILLLMGFCALIAWGLTHLLGIDMLTAYLATSPGGADSIAIIAASTNVDLGFVLAFQTVRLIIVIVVGPMIARRVARAMGHAPS